jgi:nucleoside permease NupC
MERLSGVMGIVVILAISYLLSNNRQQINQRIVWWWGVALYRYFNLLWPV